eukprot:CAMPEP_0205819468 /NCGR_PEP_ID=MMETSP0206-20130828/1855_1 /ASSEMBLY_ACC=CAM_ASM_000279 /TAXON_ID=36767 /ORGANISM="Euplotes focardii, Strain TN1" /LENGTH=365 /DNA_ID=CAMNT_0053113103 /DNA_START=49 /DNA_END=1142 /DNA_ORIENTATION=-
MAVAMEDPFAGEDYEAGLLELEKGDEMFYWLIKARNQPEEAPLVLWLQGGPGCASELAIFYENGPWTINEDLSLDRNDHSWNEVANVLYIDQPLGTGFSKTNKPDHITRNEKMVATALFKFLVKFYEKFPEYKGREFFITGESYAGHYIPAITAYIIEQGNEEINLISSAIGNGWVHPQTQYPEYRKFAVENNLVGPWHDKFLQAGYWMCENIFKIHLGALAYIPCEIVTTTIIGVPSKFNVYDIRKPCIGDGCYPMDDLTELLNKPEIQEFINVPKRSYAQCSSLISMFMLFDQTTNLQPKVEYALNNGVGILVYSGDKDFICNWRGGEAWTNDIGWEGQKRFRSAEYEKWMVDGEGAGEFKKV